jgi:UDP-glucose 4-epimerase
VIDPSAEALPDRRVLVVGGAGFVGSNLVEHLLAHGVGHVTIVDNFLSADRVNVPDAPNLDLVVGSIADDQVLARLDDEFDYVFHLATYHGNQSSIADPLADHANNLITTLKLYEHLRGSTKLQKIVYAASGCTLAPHTFDRAEAVQEDGPVPLELDSPYQISKVVGEFYSVYYHRQHGLPTVRARFQNIYGPREILGAGSWRGTPATVWRNVTPTFVYRAIKGLSLTVENGGEASRDFVYVEDLVRGLVRCARRGAPGEVYNLASGVETSILTLAESVNRLTGNPAPIRLVGRRAWDHSGKRFGSTVKASRQLDFQASIGLDDGLARTVDWTARHLPVVDRNVRQHLEMLPAEQQAELAPTLAS